VTRDEIQTFVIRVLTEIAPECDPSGLAPDTSLRDQLDLDSMDFQRFVVRLHEELGVEIPERDYPHFLTLAAATDYLSARTPR
jgi:acyl carrier protein